MSSDGDTRLRKDTSRVVVIGGGAIGLSSGYHLARSGIGVAVVEGSDLGAGASFGNAGWIVPSLVHPFNAPGAVPSAVRAMFDLSSPIAMRQFPTLSLAKWGLAFTRASSPARSMQSLRTLAVLAASAPEEMRQLADELGFELHCDGLLVAFRSEQALEAYVQAHHHVEEQGYTGTVDRLDAAGAHDREPSLGPDVTGALHLRDELSVRPNSFTDALVAGIRSAGGEVNDHEQVLSVDPVGNAQWQVVTNRRTITTDAVVVAAGDRTGQIVRPLGVRLPLQSGRGCSVTLGAGQLTLRQPLKISEYRVACTPFANGDVRISGTFDLTTVGAGTAPKRMRSVLDKASIHLPELKGIDFDPSTVWSGARPCTPDSVPLVGPVGARPGVFVATGHGTLGITLAPETGRRIADMVGTSLKSIAK